VMTKAEALRRANAALRDGHHVVPGYSEGVRVVKARCPDCRVWVFTCLLAAEDKPTKRHAALRDALIEHLRTTADDDGCRAAL
jgi:hypothetical protein